MWAKQTWTLTKKNLKITVQRHWLATGFRALVLPIAFMIFLSYAKNLLVPPVTFGVGTPFPIKTLQEGLDSATGGRNNLVFVNNGHVGGQIDEVIDLVKSSVTNHQITLLNDSSTLTTVCRSSLRGVTPCYAAIVFNSSPTEGTKGQWDYTIRADGSLGAADLDVATDDNDAEIYAMPIQRTIDFAIASLNTTNTRTLDNTPVDEMVYTSISNEEKNQEIRSQFQRLLINFMAAVLLIGMVGVCYHLGAFMAEERESGLSALLEAMMPNTARWVPQVCRLLSYWLSFTILYLPGWLIGSIFFSYGIFPQTNKGITIIYHLLAGMALTSWAILGCSFFRKAQLSGITVTLVSLVLGVIVQVLSHNRSSAIPYVLGLFFAPANYVIFIITEARFEAQSRGADLVKYPPGGWHAYPILYWVFLIIQIFGYLVLAFYAEQWMHGTRSKGRILLRGAEAESHDPIEIKNFCKTYPPTFGQKAMFWKKSKSVVAVNDVSFSAHSGQILCLLGANGAGKSTTLDAVAGLGTVTGGSIAVNAHGGIGICPQRNVLWPELTVEEHVDIWNALKAPNNRATVEQRLELIKAVDLDRKINARSKTLSGGQKRKVQLAAMLTGGSKVCCVDEVSSGLDPLSRRKIWDILMAIRGQRTIIMTTHYLDESEVLADKICIMSKGTLRAEGSSAELKTRHGGGYKITLPGQQGLPLVTGVAATTTFGLTTYEAVDSAQVSQVIRAFEKAGIEEYQLAEPTIDNVFLNLAEEISKETLEDDSGKSTQSNDSEIILNEKTAAVAVSPVDARDLELYPGRRITILGQVKVLFRKRYILFRRNWLPYVAAFLMPIFVAAIATNGLVRAQLPPSCAPGDQTASRRVNTWANRQFYNLLQGPASAFPAYSNATQYYSGLVQSEGYNLSTFRNTVLAQNLTTVNTFAAFENRIATAYNVTYPGAMWAGDSTTTPTLAYLGDYFYDSIFAQNILNNKLLGQTVATSYQSFNSAWTPDTGNSLQLVVYVCLVFSAYSAFFALYPCLERVRGVRLLEYGNGARSLSRWLAYLSFDFLIILVSSAITVGLMSGLSHVWYGLGYLFVCFVLYGVASTLLGYCISLYTASQLATFAFVAGYLAVTFLIYMIVYLAMLTYAPVNIIDQSLIIVNFTVSIITPMGSLVRALFLALNMFSAACDGFQFHDSPGNILAYGGPILYLCWQSLVLFGYLLWYDSKFSFRDYFSKREEVPVLEDAIVDDFGEEIAKVQDTNDGLRVLNVTKSYGKFTAVENVTFGIERDEIFALLGPNGAGKSTVQSMIRGDIQPSRNGGEIFVNNVRLRTHRAQARESLGVCPQLDCMDEMTVREHLRHYARMRGLSRSEIDHNVDAVLQAVGLAPFASRMGAKLSGGNKRRLMLGISILGNPAVLLLDEPSSGMDIVGQRAMWKTLQAISKGRAILLTTHSMEESSALADRAGIMAKRMLALGTIEHLRRSFGNSHYVHLVSKTAPHSSDKEILRLREWVLNHFPGAEIEAKSYHGQMRFSVPINSSPSPSSTPSPPPPFTPTASKKSRTYVDENEIEGGSSKSASTVAVEHTGSIGQIIAVLEENKDEIGVGAFSVSPSTLDTVFLNIVQRHKVEEEGYSSTEVKKSSDKKSWKRFARLGKKKEKKSDDASWEMMPLE